MTRINFLDCYCNESTDADRLLMLLEDATNADDRIVVQLLRDSLLALFAIHRGDYDKAATYAPDFAAYRRGCRDA